MFAVILTSALLIVASDARPSDQRAMGVRAFAVNRSSKGHCRRRIEISCDARFRVRQDACDRTRRDRFGGLETPVISNANPTSSPFRVQSRF